MSAALAKVHIAVKELGIDDGDYRDILERLTGQRTAKGLNDAQIGRVLEELKAKGWKPRAKARPAGRPARQADSAVAKKARALWISLYHLGEVRDPSEQALESFARRQLKCERLQWADQRQAFRLIEALKAIAERAGWSQQGASTRVTKLLLLGRQSDLLDLDHPADFAFQKVDDDELNAEIARRGVLIRERKGMTHEPA